MFDKTSASSTKTVLVWIIIILISLFLSSSNSEAQETYHAYATESYNVDEDDKVALSPILKGSPNLKVEEVLSGLDFPTSMAFLGPDDILVLEKNEGTVRRILNGQLLEEPLLDVNVANDRERGMLGIAIAEKDIANNEDSRDGKTTYVFLYYTEMAGSDDDDDDDDDDSDDDIDDDAIHNRLYRYESGQNKMELVNPELLLDLPAAPGRSHNGGKVVVGPDGNVYLTIGDIIGHDASDPSNVMNIKGGPDPDGRAGILRVTQDGLIVSGDAILGDEHPLDMYFAYGIRNSFGIDFDPITGNLWDVETGTRFGEEINLVEPGFNSGWIKSQGIWELDDKFRAQGIAPSEDNSFISQLEDYGGRGRYSSPEFTWGEIPVTTSGMAFFHSNKLGKEYENDLFVGDFVNGMIFDFDLNTNRTQLSFDNKGPLRDKLADSAEELEEVIFGYGFGGITDIKIGPDGYLYVLSLDRGGDDCKPQYPDRPCIPYSSSVGGHLFRVVPAAKT